MADLGVFGGTQIYGNPLIKGTKGWDSAMYSFQAHDATPSWPLAHQVSTASMNLQRPVPVQSLSPMGLLKHSWLHCNLKPKNFGWHLCGSATTHCQRCIFNGWEHLEDAFCLSRFRPMILCAGEIWSDYMALNVFQSCSLCYETPKTWNCASCTVFTPKPNLVQNLKCNHCAAFVSLRLHAIRPVQQRQLATQKTRSPVCWRKCCGTQVSTVLQTYKGSSAQKRDTWFHDKKSNRVWIPHNWKFGIEWLNHFCEKLCIGRIGGKYRWNNHAPSACHLNAAATQWTLRFKTQAQPQIYLNYHI